MIVMDYDEYFDYSKISPFEDDEDDLELTDEELEELMKDLPPEVWTPIKDFEGLYSVSNFGDVRNDRTGKHLKGRLNPFTPYLEYVYFLYKNGKKHTYSVHIGPLEDNTKEEEKKQEEPKKPEIRDKNGKINPFI